MVGAITPMVHASSFANLQVIADEPPAKPSRKNAGGDGLMLYIARVPGSRDVFLTTLKPREKTVTAHDVESSLYYCHLESELDILLCEDGEESDQGVDLTDTTVQPSHPDPSLHDEAYPVHPPPVPPHVNLPPRRLEGDAPALPPRSLDPSLEIKRKPVGADSSPSRKPVPTSSDVPLLPPRPTAPRSVDPVQWEPGCDSGASAWTTPAPWTPAESGRAPPPLPRRRTSTHPEDYLTYEGFTSNANQENIDARLSGPNSGPFRSSSSFDASYSRPPLPSRPPLSPRSTSSILTASSSFSGPVQSSELDKTSGGFNVTLIRRDPATGIQTNVGKITMPSASPRFARPGKALLQLFTPGYEKFRSARGTSTADLVRCISEDDACTFSSDLRLPIRRRSVKGASTPYFGDVPVNQLVTVTPSQPYAFVSPWNRVCEFSTGVSGRTIKCRHMLARGTLHDENPNAMNVVSLSELRFNTPASSVFAKVGSPKRSNHYHSSSTIAATSPLTLARKPLQNLSMTRLSHDEPYRSTFVHNRDPSAFYSTNDTTNYDDDDWDVEPMDLALGQERAGGGFRGNKAKLGKLVIEPEGLEMLDLLVAANMGVWWSMK